ncbi:STAS domain-containing protein [Kribbella sp. C-35]|uniref:STAS domain-containing protein n=1 Tax=Kribbella sp. C-35 TaxID=2789276 RepID=UPI00397C4689
MTTREALARVRRREGVAVIELIGDLNAAAEQALDEAWTAATSERPEAVVLSFENSGYINSTGIALVVGLLASARTHRIPIRAYGLSDHYREIFEITRLADFMAIEDDEESAVQGAVQGTGGDGNG